MALIVQKFGGTSVANIERIRNVAARVKKERELGNQVAVVVSAMAGVTNQLVGYVEELSPLATDEAWSEYDQVVASGEQVTSGLMALALQRKWSYRRRKSVSHRLADSAQDRYGAWQGAHSWHRCQGDP